MRKTVQIQSEIKKEFPELLFSDLQINKILDFLEHLIKWNKKINLTAIEGYNQLIYKHIFDSLAPFKGISLKLISSWCSEYVLDLGSGAGIPGIIWSILLPEIKITSIDKSKKKIGFQKFVKANLQLTNFCPLALRVEEMISNTGFVNSYNCILSRAFTQIKELLSYASVFLKPGGHLILWKGEHWKDEMRESSAQLVEQFDLLKCQTYEFQKSSLGGVTLVLKKKA